MTVILNKQVNVSTREILGKRKRQIHMRKRITIRTMVLNIGKYI